MKFRRKQRVRMIDEVYDIFLKAGWTISSNVGTITDVSSHKSKIKGMPNTNVYVVQFDNVISDKGIQHEHMALYEDEIEKYVKKS